VSKPAKRYYNLRYTKVEIAKAKALSVRKKTVGWLRRALSAIRIAWGVAVIWVNRLYMRQIVVRWARIRARVKEWTR
jgi:hypothetical protein